MMDSTLIKQAYEIAREQYAELGVDTELALKRLDQTSISVHCWQADDVGGFENPEKGLSGGIQATGNYPGKARNIEELRSDLEVAYSYIPGNHRLNLHAIYGDYAGKKIDRDSIGPEQFASWVDWAKANRVKIDFNSTLFSHSKADDGYTLSHRDEGIRSFWIEHVQRCREISEYIGKALQDTVIHNIWLPDGSKDTTVDRYLYRSNLKKSLDTILKTRKNPDFMRDAVECKLFGIGSESFVVGSHEFYLGYAVKNDMMLCLDIGHFHPTEQVSDKVSAVFQYIDELLFHVTRGVRWDSDHIVTLSDEVRALMHEIVWADKLEKVHIGLDFFDASVNRIGAYVVGTRAAQKAVLEALLSPIELLRVQEAEGNYFERLALLEESKTKPFGAVWDYYCLTKDVPAGHDYIQGIQQHEKDVLSKR